MKISKKCALMLAAFDYLSRRAAIDDALKEVESPSGLATGLDTKVYLEAEDTEEGFEWTYGDKGFEVDGFVVRSTIPNVPNTDETFYQGM